MVTSGAAFSDFGSRTQDRALDLPTILVAGGCFFLPFMNLRPDGILFTFSDLIFFLGGAALLLRGQLSAVPMGPMTSFWFVGLALLLGGLLVSSIWHGTVERWLSIGSQYAFSLIALPMMFAAASWGKWLFLARALVFGVIGMEILTFAILNYYGWPYEDIYPRFGREFLTGAGRVSGFIGGANLHAAVLCMTLPFVYYLRMTGKMSLPVFVFALGMLGTGVFYSASVTGFFSLLAMSLSFILLAGVKISARFIGLAAAAAAVFVFAGAPLPKAFDKRIGSALDSGQIEEAGTFADRLELAKESWRMTNDSLLIGVGADNYRNVSEYKMPVHNSHLLMWVEGGSASIVGWIGLFGILLFSAFATMRYDRPSAALLASVLLVLVIFSLAAPHMYARVWMAPVLLAAAPVFARLRSDG